MNNLLDAVLVDLAAEGEALDQLVAGLDETQWRTATPAAGWDVATQIGHLLWTDEMAIAAAGGDEAWQAALLPALEALGGPLQLDDLDAIAPLVDHVALKAGRVTPTQLLARWRSARSDLQQRLRELPATQRIPWFGPPMSATSMATARLMETWAHGLDIHAALGVTPQPTDRIRHIAHLTVRTRDFAFLLHELTPPAEAFRVDVVAPSGELWSWGPDDAAQTVTGSAYDLCLLATQRIHRDDTDLVPAGADADRWLDIAQCFAGPSGAGRARAAGQPRAAEQPGDGA